MRDLILIIKQEKLYELATFISAYSQGKQLQSYSIRFGDPEMSWIDIEPNNLEYIVHAFSMNVPIRIKP